MKRPTTMQVVRVEVYGDGSIGLVLRDGRIAVLGPTTTAEDRCRLSVTTYPGGNGSGGYVDVPALRGGYVTSFDSRDLADKPRVDGTARVRL